MSNFRTKLLGLAALATAFAGASYGQTYSISATAPAGALNIRAEATNELVGNQTITITPNAGDVLVSNATITVFMSAPVTSTPAAGATAANPIINAVLTCNSGGGSPYFGTLDATGKQISFSNVTLAAFVAAGPPVTTITSCQLTGVRVNANAVTASATLTSVTASTAVTVNGVTASTAIPATVAYIFTTFATPVIGNFTAAAVAAPIAPIFTSTGNPAKASTVPSFYASMGTTLAGAFKTCQGENGDGLATFGTRIQLVFANVPSQATVWVPTSIAVTGIGAGFNFALVTSPTAADTNCAAVAATLPLATASPLATAPNGVLAQTFSGTTFTYGGSAALTASNGSATAVYEVQATPGPPALKITGVQVPVYVTLPAGALATGSGFVTVLESYSPQATAAAATTIPNFAPTTATALNSVNIITSQTSLLFPYVVSQLGFDTGIAIANTTADPFGTVGSSGTCTFNVYGAAQPTPNTNIAAGGTIAAGTNGTPFLLSSIAPGFSGYMIAQCNFIDAYGYAYIEYNLTQNNGVSEGYVAVQLNRVNGQPASIGN